MLIFSRAFVLVILLTTAVSVLSYGGNETDTALPFNITSPNTPVTWFIGQSVNISWSIPTDTPTQYTGQDGYGCYVALFNSTDPSVLLSYISQTAVFSLGHLSWTVSSNAIPLMTYLVGVGYGKYVISRAEILIAALNSTTSASVTAASATAASAPLSTVQLSSSIPTQNAQDDSMQAQFAAVGGVGGLVGIVIGGTLVVGGILGIMGYNSCRGHGGRSPAMPYSSQYGGEGSSYVPKSDETSYTNDYNGAKAAQTMSQPMSPPISPPTSPGLRAINVSSSSPQATLATSSSNRSTYTPFSKRNPNPHHDNVDLLPVDPFSKPVPAYVLTTDQTVRPTDRDRQQRAGKSGGASEPEENRPYNFI